MKVGVSTLKNIFIVFVSFFLLTACSELQPTKYIKFSTLGLVVDLPYLEKCFKDAGVKYKVQNNAIYVDDPDAASDNCS
jgi:hypothetical protein